MPPQMPAQPEFSYATLFDITPDEKLPFAVYVFFKGKHIRYRESGEALQTETYNRFIYKRINKIYIQKKEYALFEQYSSSKKKAEEDAYNDPKQSVEQKISNQVVRKLTKNTQRIFAGDDADLGKSVESAFETVSDIISNTMAKPYLRIFDKLAESPNSVINHSMRVSLMSTFVGYSLGFVNPEMLEYLAAAGLLHDLGKTRMNFSDELEFTEEEEKLLMRQHPAKSVEILERVPSVPDEVKRIILEHHECRDGSGYPNGITGGRMHNLSKVFTIVNTFDNMAGALPGNKNEKYQAAAKFMSEKLRTHFDPTILPRALKILSGPMKLK
ncbi:MAG: HD domain-containing protein [Deltaproteobacteria bacterium]|nr:HD domain-containing protein [Deltaproteobacteria bacterium]